MRRFDTLLFDLDGTLADPAEGFTRCVSHALEVVGLPAVPRPRIEDRIGPPLEDTFRALGGAPHQIDALVGAYRDRYRETGILENEVYPAIPEILAALKAEGYALHVATSKPRVFAETILKHFEIRSFFGEVFGSNLDGSLTHKRDILLHAQNETNFGLDRTAMIGDRRFDMEAACEVGLYPVGVRWGYGSQRELADSGAMILVESPLELAAALKS